MSTSYPELPLLREGLTQAAARWLDETTTAWEDWSTAWSRSWTRAAEAGADAAAGVTASWLSGRGGHGPCHDDPPDRMHPDEDRHGHRHTQWCGHRHGHRHTQGCGHGHSCVERRCRCCRDECSCCVPEADVVVRMRAGELRIVPFRIDNRWRRERPVSIEVGPWHRCDGPALAVTAELEQDALTLPPCTDAVVRLAVSARAAPARVRTRAPEEAASPDDLGEAAPEDTLGNAAEPLLGHESGALGAGTTELSTARRKAADVAGCASAYADVRFEGCGRPVRVALVVLPSTCDPVDIDCGCGCCCSRD